MGKRIHIFIYIYIYIYIHIYILYLYITDTFSKSTLCFGKCFNITSIAKYDYVRK